MGKQVGKPTKSTSRTRDLYQFSQLKWIVGYQGEEGDLIFICGQGKHTTGLPILTSGTHFFFGGGEMSRSFGRSVVMEVHSVDGRNPANQLIW